MPLVNWNTFENGLLLSFARSVSHCHTDGWNRTKMSLCTGVSASIRLPLSHTHTHTLSLPLPLPLPLPLALFLSVRVSGQMKNTKNPPVVCLWKMLLTSNDAKTKIWSPSINLWYMFTPPGKSGRAREERDILRERREEHVWTHTRISRFSSTSDCILFKACTHYMC